MIDKAQRAALKRLAGKRSKADLKALFALIRAHDDRALLNAVKPAPRPAPRRNGDALLREIEHTLKPLMARSAEKADLLVEHLARKRRGLAIEPRGLADAVRKLRAAKLTDAQIRTGATKLMADLSRLYDGRETVV